MERFGEIVRDPAAAHPAALRRLRRRATHARRPASHPEACGFEPASVYAATEALVPGSSSPQDQCLEISEDVLVVEVVDQHGRPAATGVCPGRGDWTRRPERRPGCG
jgi:hypothetical protein